MGWNRKDRGAPGTPRWAVRGAEAAWRWQQQRAEPGGRPARWCPQMEGSGVLAGLASEAGEVLGLARDLGDGMPSCSARFQQRAPPALTFRILALTPSCCHKQASGEQYSVEY